MAEIVSQYRIEVKQAVDALNQVAQATDAGAKKSEDLGKKTEQAGQKANKAAINFTNLGKQILSAFGLTAGVVTFVNALKNAVMITANFEAQMSKVRAVSGATADQMAKLEKSAKQLGATTRFTATQVGELQEEYARLGFTTGEILAATEATLNLAAATGSTLAEAAEVAGSTLRAFDLDASETTRVADVMGASFAASSLNMERFRESMKMVAPVARTAGISLEMTTAMLAQLSKVGITGSLAGTGLKNIMFALSDANSKLAQDVGFAVKNNEDLIRAFQVMREKGIDLTEALELTDKRAVTAFVTLKDGIEDVSNLSKNFDNANGTIKAMAEIMDDNLNGAVTRLSSAWEALNMNITEGGRGVMTDFINSLTGEIDRLNVSVGKLRGSGEDFSVFGFIAGNVAKALGEPFRVANNVIERFADTYDYLSRKIDRANYEVGLQGEALAKWNKMSTEAKDRLVEWSKAVSEGTDIQNDAIGPLENFVDTISGGASEPIKNTIRNIAFLTKAIKLLKEEAEKEGTTRERIREIMREIIPLETELAELLGKETDAMKALREETEKATKAEEDRLAALDKASDEKLKKRLEVDAFIAERTAMGLKEEMDAAILAEQQKAMLMEADAMNVGLSQEKIEAIRQASVDEQLRIQNEYGTKIQEIEDAGVEAVKDSEEEKAKIRQKKIEESVNEFNQYAQIVQSVYNAISSAIIASYDNELTALQNSLEAGEISQEQYDRKRRQLARERANEEKASAIFSAILGTAVAVVNALQTQPFLPLGPIMAVLAGAQGAAQIAAIASQPLPQFAEGGWVDGRGMIQGRAHAQGGVKLEAEGGEFIVNRAASAKNAALIEAINKGMGEAYIMRKWVAPAVDSALLNGWRDVGKSADLNGLTATLKDHNIIRAMDRNRETTAYGFKLLADKLNKRTPKRGGYA